MPIEPTTIAGKKAAAQRSRRRHEMPFGAQIETDGRVRFALWAPSAQKVELCFEPPRETAPIALAARGDGWYEATVAAAPGDRYRFRIDGETLVADPAARFQPGDVLGASEVVDPTAFEWRDVDWTGRPWHEAVLYELHVGAFSPEGTYDGAIAKLDALVELGVTAIELMPLSDAPGRRNWGYDGVLPFAPDARYGRPEDLKRLVVEAHRRGLMVFLDVVYNHFGPEGNFLRAYAKPFFTDRHKTPWGAAIDYEGDGRGDDRRAVRDFVVHNALYWLTEYNLDGLRLDAVHEIYDDERSGEHVLFELARRVHAEIGEGRRVHLVLENDANVARFLRPDPAGGSPGFTAQWNDDVHHALHVIASGESGGYYADYADDPVGRLARGLTEGFVYQGEPSAHRGGACRGEPTADLPLTKFVNFLQNHDQIGNRAFGDRITEIAPAAAVRAVTSTFLLAPSPPLLFMGEEWGASSPFLFFCDFEPELARLVAAGRRREFASFPQFRDERQRERIPDPGADETFVRSRLKWDEREHGKRHREWLAFHHELLALRRSEIVPRLERLAAGVGRFERVGERGLRVRWGLDDGSVLALDANYGDEPLAGFPPLERAQTLHVANGGEEVAEAQALPAWGVRWSLAR